MADLGLAGLHPSGSLNGVGLTASIDWHKGRNVTSGSAGCTLCDPWSREFP